MGKQKVRSRSGPTSKSAGKTSSGAKVMQQIDQLIADGVLAPGQRLVESDLMTELNASRGGVREALRMLAGDGVVELLPNKGARIAKLSPERLSAMLEVFDGIFRIARDLFLSRPILPEGKQALLLAQKKVAATIPTNSATAMMDAMAEYHMVVSAHCGNEYLQHLLKKLHIRHYSKQVARMINVKDVAAACKAYAELTQCLLTGDAERARNVLTVHVKEALKQVHHANPEGSPE